MGAASAAAPGYVGTAPASSTAASTAAIRSRPGRTAAGTTRKSQTAWRAIPAIEELPIDEIWVGHRPGSRDDAPILGRGPLENLFYATGHHRNGILLAPVTADAMARLILDDVVEPTLRPFGLERFLPARAAE